MKIHIQFRCICRRKNSNIMEKIKFEEVQRLLDSGKKPEEVFDWVDSSYNGFRVVSLNYKRNYIDVNNKLLSKKWFDMCYDFSNGLGKVELDGKEYRIDKDGNVFPFS